MTTIAILADIHGNLPALNAVIDDLQRHPVDEVIVAGDMVGRGPQGSLVIERILALGWPSVRGNHEDYMINFARQLVPKDWLDAEYWCASRWMAAELDRDHIDYIASLPDALTPTTSALLHVVHGTPRSNNEGIGTWTNPDLIDDFLRQQAPTPVLVCAHTHRAAHIRREGLGHVVNVGSVGLPFNGDTRAQYALFRCEPSGHVHVELRQVAYDLDDTLRRYHDTGFLHDCGFTSALLRQELLHARPFLVPFLRWSELLKLDACDPDSRRHFLSIYDPTVTTESFIQRLIDQMRAHADKT
jgi:predicted phosphodiesterase